MIQTLWISGILLRAGESVMRTAWVHGQRPLVPNLSVGRLAHATYQANSILSMPQTLHAHLLLFRRQVLFPRLKAKGAGGTTSFDAPYTFECLLVWVHALFHNLNLFSLGFWFPALGIFVVQLLCHFRLFWNLWTAAH